MTPADTITHSGRGIVNKKTRQAEDEVGGLGAAILLSFHVLGYDESQSRSGCKLKHDSTSRPVFCRGHYSNDLAMPQLDMVKSTTNLMSMDVSPYEAMEVDPPAIDSQAAAEEQVDPDVVVVNDMVKAEADFEAVNVIKKPRKTRKDKGLPRAKVALESKGPATVVSGERAFSPTAAQSVYMVVKREQVPNASTNLDGSESELTSLTDDEADTAFIHPLPTVGETVKEERSIPENAAPTTEDMDTQDLAHFVSDRPKRKAAGRADNAIRASVQEFGPVQNEKKRQAEKAGSPWSDGDADGEGDGDAGEKETERPAAQLRTSHGSVSRKTGGKAKRVELDAVTGIDERMPNAVPDSPVPNAGKRKRKPSAKQIESTIGDGNARLNGDGETEKATPRKKAKIDKRKKLKSSLAAESADAMIERLNTSNGMAGNEVDQARRVEIEYSPGAQ